MSSENFMTHPNRKPNSYAAPKSSALRLSLALAAIIFFAVILSASSIASQTQSAAPSARSTQSSRPAAAQTLAQIDLAGYNKLLADHRGKPLLVTFWATWCEPCRDEFPTLVELTKQYEPQGLAVFGVSLDANADMHVVRHFLEQFRPQFPNYRQDPQIDVDEFYQGVNPNWQGSMPETIFYTRDGRIAVHF